MAQVSSQRMPIDRSLWANSEHWKDTSTMAAEQPEKPFGWGWQDGEDDDAGNEWIEIGTLVPDDGFGVVLDEELATLMLRNAVAMADKYPGIRQQREDTAQFIVDAMNEFAANHPDRLKQLLPG